MKTRGVIIISGSSSDSTHSPKALQHRAPSSRLQSTQRDMSGTAAAHQSRHT